MPYAERFARLRDLMRETDTDLVALGPSSHMVYMTGLSPHGDERPVMLLVGRDSACFLMPALNADSSRAKTDLPFFPWADAEGPGGALARALDATLGGKRSPSVALDETMRADFALLLLDALPGARRRFTDDTVGRLRARKDAAEFAVLKANALLNDRAMQAAYAALRPGVTEIEIARLVEAFYEANGAGTQFRSVCFGENGAFPHHHSGSRTLKPGEPVLIDIGGRMDGYPSDMTRVAHLGEPSRRFAEVAAVVEAAVMAGIAAAKPGVLASTVDRAARSVIEAAGYGPQFVHRTGHGLGIDIHEPPYITATSDTVLEEGHVFSIEPGIYLPGEFGVRLEEIVILRADGAEVLSELPRATHIVGA
ncbi:Xaa-Pro peptidase family protein [Alsobacter sp. SYSU M60028]|uniref:Xaa-Pro peptidase family protein n=1 Tax=Alsobacter ponti TaxID=2962936 RepID=A0ABT1LEA5_9HYPH|nr:Xaa-Pro peptidase family protein [Alsobacter ponti]MCP8939837.1 Xaa-Pro peptidase family protein [Alsobacter ponti]